MNRAPGLPTRPPCRPEQKASALFAHTIVCPQASLIGYLSTCNSLLAHSPPAAHITWHPRPGTQAPSSPTIHHATRCPQSPHEYVTLCPHLCVSRSHSRTAPSSSQLATRAPSKCMLQMGPSWPRMCSKHWPLPTSHSLQDAEDGPGRATFFNISSTASAATEAAARCKLPLGLRSCAPASCKPVAVPPHLLPAVLPHRMLQSLCR